MATVKALLRRLRRLFTALYRIAWRADEEHPRVRDMWVMEHFERRRETLSRVNPLLAAGRHFYSQSDEDGLIEEVWRRVGTDQEGVFVEFGVGTGLENNSIMLLARGWRGVWVGFQDLDVDVVGASRLKFLKRWITLDNVISSIDEGLAAIGNADVDLISMDLDGNDLHLCRRILETGRRPRVFVVEYNAKFPPPIRWAMPYDAAHVWDASDYRGASLQSFVDLFSAFDYRLVACNVTGVNAFFVPTRFAPAFADVPTDLGSLYVPLDLHWFVTTGLPASPRTVASLMRD
jgi:hypothetical protein